MQENAATSEAAAVAARSPSPIPFKRKPSPRFPEAG
jgi:hypothetical protein